MDENKVAADPIEGALIEQPSIFAEFFQALTQAAVDNCTFISVSINIDGRLDRDA